MERATPILYKASQYWLMLSALLSVSLFVATFPPITIGLWPQSELVNISMLGISLAMGVGLLGVSFKQPQRVLSYCYHPLVICFFLIGGLSFLFSFTNAFPKRSWFGAPELGEGALWYIALSLMTMSFLYLKNKVIFKKVLAVYAVISALFVTLLTLKGDKIGLWRPYFFNDYLAFYGLFLFPILVYFGELNSKKAIAAAFFVSCVPIIVSGNHSAEPLIILLPIIAMLAYALRHWQSMRLLSIIAVLLTPLLMVGLVFLLGYYFPPGSKLALLTQSIWSRYELFQTVWQSWQHNGWQLLLLGQGWGSFTDIAATYIPIQEIKLFMLSSSGTDKAYWDALSRADFHSHAQVIEAIVSIGVIGSVLILMYPALLVRYASKQQLPIAIAVSMGFVMVSAMWFQFAITVPFMVLGFVSLTPSVCKMHVNFWRQFKKSRLGFIVAIVSMCFALSFLTYGTIESFLLAKHSTKFATPEKTKLSASRQCGDELGDMTYGGQRLAIVNHEVNYFLAHTEDPFQEDWYDRFDWLRCAVDRYLAHSVGARFYIIDLLGRAEWAFSQQEQKNNPQVIAMLQGWEKDLETFLHKAPTRSDLAAPYLVWRISQQQEERAYQFARKLYRQNHHDPVALWFVGLYELKDESTARFGLDKMRSALKLGIQNIMPIEQDLIDQLSKTIA